MNKREIILALTKLILSRVALESMRKSNWGNLYVQGDFILVWEGCSNATDHISEEGLQVKGQNKRGVRHENDMKHHLRMSERKACSCQRQE